MPDAATTPTIQLNGKAEPLAAATIAALLEEKDIEMNMRGIAIAVNGAVVPRAAWPVTRLATGDVVEIVRALQGG